LGEQELRELFEQHEREQTFMAMPTSSVRRPGPWLLRLLGSGCLEGPQRLEQGIVAPLERGQL
jgi:hypothetical protein